MNASATLLNTEPESEQLTFEQLLEQGLALRAWRTATAAGPFPDFDSASSLVAAGRMAWQLGGPLRSRWWFRRAWQRFPQDPHVRYYRALNLFERRGPYQTWRFLQEQDLPPETDAELRASWYALHGQVAGVLRDFDIAESWLCRADKLAPESPWVHVCWSYLFECEDRYDEALEIGQRALRLRSWYRPAVQAVGHLLTLQNRDDEAIEFLKQASMCIESGAVTAQCYALQLELDRYDDAALMLERYCELSPLMEKSLAQWVAGQRSKLAYERGDMDAAIQYARQTKIPYFTTIADRLSEPGNGQKERVELAVPFVRQHHVTCVPATLTAISRYWSMPADHVSLANEICYNGTSAYNERHWADTHGWVTREFSVTPEAAKSLLDQGIPFTLTTVSPTSGHLQAIIGYDSRRGTLLIRDPYMRHSTEAIGDEFLQHFRSTGPRGMALVPQSQRDKLESLCLPDAEQWDRVHELDAALDGHRRADGQAIYDRMVEQWPEHWLTVEARRRLAGYDADLLASLAAIESQLTRVPDDERLLLARLSCLRDLSRRADRLAIYEKHCAKRDSHPIFWSQFAQELQADAKCHPEAIKLLHRALRVMPLESSNYYVLANLLWEQQLREEAWELYRFATCLDNTSEELAGAYFIASRQLGQTQPALDFLRGRFERLGSKSGLPARTLHDAYQRLERPAEALQILSQALAMRPEDGSLRLFAAKSHLSTSLEHSAVADELMQQAAGKVAQSDWLSTAARLAAIRGDSAKSLEHWRELLKLQPLLMPAHAEVARLLRETQGQAATLEYLEQATSQFPNYQPLWELRCEWLYEERPDARELIVRQVVEANPDNAWARRELGFVLCQQKRLQEAWAEYDIGARLDPHNISTHMLRAFLQRDEGRIAEARSALRDAIRISVDYELAINSLMDLAYTLEEKRGELEFLRTELERQVIFGDGVLAYRRHARRALPDDEVLKLLQLALKARPDLWHAWSANVQQLLDMDLVDEAWELSQQATNRFPLLPRLWLDQAMVCYATENWDAQHAAMEAAYRINPGWSEVIHELKAARLRQGDYEGARRVIEQALSRDPRDPSLKLEMAELLWYGKQQDAALQQAEEAVRIEPGFESGWQKLHEWSTEMGCPDRALNLARSLTDERPHEARSWLLLANMLSAPEQLAEALEALDRVVVLSPRNVEAYDRKANRLAAAGRIEEALAACRPALWGEHRPVELRITEAEIIAHSGDMKQAIALLEATLAEEPNSFYGWSRLADKYRELSEWNHYLRTARELVRIAPHHAMSLGYLGDALFLTQDRKGAKQAWERATQLDPSYDFAGYRAFDMQLEDNEAWTAAETLSRMRHHVDGPLMWCREVQLATRHLINCGTAVDHLKKICITPWESGGPLVVSLEAMRKIGWLREARDVLENAMEHPSVHSEVFTQWGNLQAEIAGASSDAPLLSVLKKYDLGKRAVGAFLESLLQLGKGAAAKDFVERNESLLRSNTHTWGSGGYVLCAMRHYPAAAKWFSDWRNRPDAEPWMLVNAVEGFKATRQEAEATEVYRHAITLPPAQGQQLHRLWMAVESALKGEVDQARQLVTEVNVESLDADYKFILTLIECLLEMASTPSDRRAEVFRQVRSRLSLLHQGYTNWKFEPARRVLYRRTLRRMLMLDPNWFAKLWCVWQWIDAFSF